MLDGCLLPTSVTDDFPGNLPPWVHMPTALHRCTHADTDLYRDDTYTPVHTHSHKDTLVDTCIHKTYNMGRHAQTCRNRYTCTKTQIHNTQDHTLTWTPLCTQ